MEPIRDFKELKYLSSWKEFEERFNSVVCREEMIGLLHTVARFNFLSDSEQEKNNRQRAKYYLDISIKHPDKSVKEKARKDLFGVILEYTVPFSNLNPCWWMRQNEAWNFLRLLIDFLASSCDELKEMLQKDPFCKNVQNLFKDLYRDSRKLYQGTVGDPIFDLEGPASRWDKEFQNALGEPHIFNKVVDIVVNYKLYTESIFSWISPEILNSMRRKLFGHEEGYSEQELKKILLEKENWEAIHFLLKLEKGLKRK